MEKISFYDEYYTEANTSVLNKLRRVGKFVSRSGFRDSLTKKRHWDAKVNPSDFHYFQSIEEPVYDSLTRSLEGNIGKNEMDPKRFVERVYIGKMSGNLLKRFLNKESFEYEYMSEAPWDSNATRVDKHINKADAIVKKAQTKADTKADAINNKARKKADVHINKAHAINTIQDKKGGKVSSVNVYPIMPNGKVYLITMVDENGNDSFYVAANSNAMKNIEKITKRSFKSVVEQNAGSFGKEFDGSSKDATSSVVATIIDNKKLLTEEYIAKAIGLGSDWVRYVTDIEDDRYGVGRQFGTKATGLLYTFKNIPNSQAIVISDKPEWLPLIVEKRDIKAYKLDKNGKIEIKKAEFLPAQQSTNNPNGVNAQTPSQPQVPTAKKTKATAQNSTATATQTSPAQTAPAPQATATSATQNTAVISNAPAQAPTTTNVPDIQKEDLKASPIFFAKTPTGKTYMFVKPTYVTNYKLKPTITGIPGNIQGLSITGLGAQRWAVPVDDKVIDKIKAVTKDEQIRDLAAEKMFTSPDLNTIVSYIVPNDYIPVEGKFRDHDVYALMPNPNVVNDSFIQYRERMLAE